jgi:hypothetical protein
VLDELRERDGRLPGWVAAAAPPTEAAPPDDPAPGGGGSPQLDLAL